MTSMATPILIRFPNMLILLINLDILVGVGNTLNYFINIDIDRAERSIITFAQICIEIYLNKGLLDQILQLAW